jgi:hypothetical protein
VTSLATWLERLAVRAATGRLDVDLGGAGADRARVLVRRGLVCAVSVPGRFDPIVDALRRSGAIDGRTYRRILEALARTERRSGQVAVDVGALHEAVVRDALVQQTRLRLVALLDRAAGATATFTPCDVAPSEQVASVDPVPLLPVASRPAPHVSLRTPATRPEARRQLREIAKRLHPDRNGHLPAPEREKLAAELARATAAFHGLS